MAATRSRLRLGFRTVAVWIRPRARLVSGGFLVGLAASIVVVSGLTIYGGSVAFGTRKAFAIGALVLGFATLGWSGSILAGRSVEHLQRHLNTTSDWTEADSRRAMARILGVGVGMVVGVAAVDVLL